MSRLDQFLAEAPEIMGVDDVANLLGLNPRTVSNWLKDGHLPGYKLPGRWLVLREELHDFLDSAHTGYIVPTSVQTRRQEKSI